jgi:hypothetical protein
MVTDAGNPSRPSPDPPLSLPDTWLRTIRSIEVAAESAHLQHAIVGSLGLAISLGTPWQPWRSSLAHRPRALRDLDVFLIGPPAARQRFRELFPATVNPASPRIDLVAAFHNFTEFNLTEAALQYRAVRVPVALALFVPVRIAVGDLTVPVLHPRVHSHLMGMQPRLIAQSKASMRAAAAVLAVPLPRFPPVPEGACRPFHAFRAERRRRYPVRERLLAVRMLLWEWEAEGRARRLVAPKVYIRERYPQLAAVLRRLFG